LTSTGGVGIIKLDAGLRAGMRIWGCHGARVAPAKHKLNGHGVINER